ncbi:T9SS type A sorting domain-containing protein [Flavobacterium ardleyense]|uniref:T9SS type A sorting domain-containing protein n=1 Tax=Flavobacterium ardleyense TaxID=2038737 RepID=A0ABW5Z8H3_9FLAO
MKKNYILFLFLISNLVSAQIQSCLNANPICADGSLIANTTNNISAATVGCLISTPNQKWYIFKVGDSGDISLKISQGDNAPSYDNQDIDFISWGPFDHLPDCTTELYGYSSNFTQASNVVGCSYSASSIENFNLLNAPSGKFYVIMSTNYSNLPGSILVQQINQREAGAGSLICDYVIIDQQPDNRTYAVNGTVSFSLETLNASTYRWEMSTNGTDYSVLSEGGSMPAITGVETNTLTLANTPSIYDGYSFRALASNNGDSVYSKVSTLNSTLSQNSFENNLFSAYYDATKDVIVIKNNDNTNAKFQYNLYELNGRLISSATIQSQIENVSTANCYSGVYLLELFNGETRQVKKIIKR